MIYPLQKRVFDTFTVNSEGDRYGVHEDCDHSVPLLRCLE